MRPHTDEVEIQCSKSKPSLLSKSIKKLQMDCQLLRFFHNFSLSSQNFYFGIVQDWVTVRPRLIPLKSLLIMSSFYYLVKIVDITFRCGGVKFILKEAGLDVNIIQSFDGIFTMRIAEKTITANSILRRVNFCSSLIFKCSLLLGDS